MNLIPNKDTFRQESLGSNETCHSADKLRSLNMIPVLRIPPVKIHVPTNNQTIFNTNESFEVSHIHINHHFCIENLTIKGVEK